MAKYEVTVSATIHGSFTVEARDESEAEEIVNLRWGSCEITSADLEDMDEVRIDCVGELKE